MFTAKKEIVDETSRLEKDIAPCHTMNQQHSSTNKPIILMITRHGHLTAPVMDYGLNVADRLNKKLLIAHVNTLPLLNDGGKRSRYFATAFEESSVLIRAKAKQKGVAISNIKETGKISKVVNRLCRILKKIEFIVLDHGIQQEDVISHSPVPVFSIFQNEGMKEMDLTQ